MNFYNKLQQSPISQWTGNSSQSQW
jgi:hypothetical protein